MIFIWCLDVAVDIPQTLDIGYLRGYGKKPDEDLLPEEAEVPAQVVRSKEQERLFL